MTNPRLVPILPSSPGCSSGPPGSRDLPGPALLNYTGSRQVECCSGPTPSLSAVCCPSWSSARPHRPLTIAAPPRGPRPQQRAVNLLQPLQVSHPALAGFAGRLLHGCHHCVEIVLQDVTGTGLRGGTSEPKSWPRTHLPQLLCQVHSVAPVLCPWEASGPPVQEKDPRCGIWTVENPSWKRARRAMCPVQFDG
jgi:hypothetical protein